MPAFSLVREAFRFYRMKSQTLVRALFLFAYALCILRSVFPRDDDNLQDLLTYVLTMSSTGIGVLNPVPAPAVSSINLVWFAVQAVVSLALLLIAFAYASSYVAENEGDNIRLGLSGFLRSTPRLFAFFFMFFGISFISSALASTIMMLFVLIAGVLTMYFLPLLLSRTKMKLMWAVNRSFVHTRGYRFFIFNCLLMLTVIVNLVSNFFRIMLPVNVWVDGILGGFFTAALTLMHGRLMGGLYFVVIKHVETLPDVMKKEADTGS